MTVEQINNSTGEVLYLHHDQAGSTPLLTGSTGKVEGSYTYGPYGETTGHTGTTTTPLGYDGQYTSSDTGLIYMRARVYDPATPQFLTVDPKVGTTRAPYTYADDNPLNEADPSGRESLLGEIGHFLEPLNPVKYYEEEIESYENGCGYFASVAHGLEGAVVGVLDASGAGEEGAAAEEGAVGIEAEITGFTRHGLEQALGREGVGVNEQAMLDAVNAPERVVQEANGTTRFIGKDATVVLNSEGSVVTTWAR
jgi:RHS repeat-associated protein